MESTLAFIMHVGTALLLGAAIGLERQFGQHLAGLRTNTLVSLGAALFVSVGLLFEGEHNPTRVAGQVVTGVGFLGAGVLMKEGLNIRGLNTAATLWCSAAVGTLAGGGLLLQAVIGAAAVLAANLALRPAVQKIDALRKTAVYVETIYRLRVSCEAKEAAVVRSIVLRHVNAHPAMTVQGISTKEAEPAGSVAVEVDIYSRERGDKFMNDLVTRLCIEPNVSAVTWEQVR
jgi:putative Mg2+ transporter-C (MgtC) family protein